MVTLKVTVHLTSCYTEENNVRYSMHVQKEHRKDKLVIKVNQRL